MVTKASTVTRRIWGSPDAVLFICVGATAEFAASKSVDWLFCTGEFPQEPVKRFFNTVRFIQYIFSDDPEKAGVAIERMNRSHERVEESRGAAIPQWAYRGILLMLVEYGEKAHTVVFEEMSDEERIAHFEDWKAIGGTDSNGAKNNDLHKS